MAAVHAGHHPEQPFDPMTHSAALLEGSPGAPQAMQHQQDPFQLLGPGNPLLQMLQLAQLAASLPAQQHGGGQQFAAGAPPSAAPPLALPAAPPAAAAAAAATPGPGPHAATSGTSSERLAVRPGDATIELATAPNGSIAGLKLPVTCNDIRGVVYLDQQVVACYCPSCEQRVAHGHGRPLFSFTRFERHSGSKAKKWRLSIRIDPGAVKEAPPDEPPLALGQWLESKGLVSWAPRGGLKIGPSNAGGGGSSDDEGSPLYGEDSGGMRRPFASAATAGDRRPATLGPRPVAYAAAVPAGPGGPASAVGGNGGPSTYGSLLGKRLRQDYDTPDLPQHADRQQWLESQWATFDAVVTAAAANSNGGGASSSSGNGSSGSASKHAAIFSLVYGLLDEGEDRRAFNEIYLPWLNDLPRQRLDAEFATLHSYLALLESGMEPGAVRGLMSAYIKAILAKAAAW